MKQLLMFITMFVALFVNAQEGSESPKVMWGINFSPDYNFRTLSGEVTIDNVVRLRNNLEIPKFGYTTGLNVLAPLSRKLSLEAGIQYSSKGYKTKKQPLIFETPNPNEPTTAENQYSMEYIGIPLKTKFLFGSKKTRFYTSLGLVTNFLLAANSITVLEYANASPKEEKADMKDQYHQVDLSVNVAAGVDYSISKNVLLFAEPTFRYGLLNAAKSSIAEHLWSVGINLGAYFRFK